MEAIGAILRAEREKRGLSLQDVHESTRITAQNLAALEEDRFDAFPNRVYARAFLRDYANFLGLDSGGLLARYEEEWAAGVEAPAAAAGGSAWRALAAALLVLVVVGGLSAATYFGWYGTRARPPGVAATNHSNRAEREVATLPKPVAPVGPEALGETGTKPKPEAKPEAATDRVTLELATLGQVWVRVRCDGQKVLEETLPKGEKRSFDARRQIDVRVGRPQFVRIKANEKLQPPLGPPDIPSNGAFTRPAAADASEQPASTGTAQQPNR